VVFENGKEECVEAWCLLANVSDASDPLRMLKHALAFVGGVAWNGVRLHLCNRGVSRSGFASSSAVAINLLAALYTACGVHIEPVHCASLALLFENQLGLKSGRQDVDGPLYSGLKHLVYRQTSRVVLPEIEMLHVPLNLVLVDTGVRRPTDTSLKRGLNMRHLAFLSRDPVTFLSIRKSLGIHGEIVEAVRKSNWPLLGHLFAE
jgi:mevalonate kinase